MCILFISTEHPQYRLIALSNRDEVFSRPTASASWHQDVLSPVDLAKAEHGTWIAISRQGRISVLLNVSEVPTGKEDVSRGVFATNYVKSHDEDFAAWFDRLQEFSHRSAGFNLVCGELDINANGDFHIVTNRGEKPSMMLAKGSYCLSNAVLGIVWPKTTIGGNMLRDMIAKIQGCSEQHIIDRGFEMLSTNALTQEELEHPTNEMLHKSIFIPRLELEGDFYGTRTQTVILVDNNGHAKYVEKDVLSGRIKEHSFELDENIKS